MNGDSSKWQISISDILNLLGHPDFNLIISNHFDVRTCKHSTQRTDSACFWVSGRVQALFITKLRWPLKPGMGGASKGQTELPLPWSWWWELPGAHDTTRTLRLVTVNCKFMDFDRETHFFFVFMYLVLTNWVYRLFGVLSLCHSQRLSHNLWHHLWTSGTMRLVGG